MYRAISTRPELFCAYYEAMLPPERRTGATAVALVKVLRASGSLVTACVIRR